MFTIEISHFEYIRFFLQDDCNDLFSRFEQQISILEKLAEATDPTMDRHGHNGPSQGLVSKYLENLKLGTENLLSELRNEMAGQTSFYVFLSS